MAIKTNTAKIGSGYQKIPIQVDYGKSANGSFKAVFAKLYPPYVRPVRMWAKVQVSGLTNSTSGSPDNTKDDWRIGEGLTIVNRWKSIKLPKDHSANDDPSVVWDRYAQEDFEDPIGDEDSSPAANYGISGVAALAAGNKTQIDIFKRKTLCTAANGIITGAGHWVPRDGFKIDHKFRWPPMEEGMAVIGAINANTFPHQSDWDEIMASDHSSMETLYENIAKMFPEMHGAALNVDASPIANTDIANWLQAGYVVSQGGTAHGSAKPVELVVHGTVTVKFNVYEPSGRNIVRPL